VSDTPGLPSAVGIEAVEWVSEGATGVTVRITGRWRRRRPDWHGPAMLVVETAERRTRIPAMPEPPSLAGPAPGMWRMSFSVPTELVAHLEGRTWLQLGAVMVPLSLRRGDEPPPPRPPLDRELLAERELRSYQAAAQGARRRAEEAEARAADLGEEIARLREDVLELRREPDRLRAEIEAREAELRTVRQQLHAETGVREELADRLASEERVTHVVRARAQRLAAREEELQRELQHAHRSVDEAEHDAAAARAALLGAERELAQLRGSVGSAPAAPMPAAPQSPPDVAPPEWLRVDALRREAELSAVAPPRLAPPPATGPGVPARAFAGERELVARRAQARYGREVPTPDQGPLIAALEADLQAERATLEAEREARIEAQARVAGLERDLAAAREHAADALRAIVEFRQELRALAASEPVPTPTDPPPTDPPPPDPPPPAAESPPPAAESPPPAAESPRPPEAEVSAEPAAEATPAAEVEAERLSAALERLREQHAPGDAGTAPAEGGAMPVLRPDGPDAVRRLFHTLVRENPAAAGRLLVGLLPAQHLAHPRPVAYDLVLEPEVCLRVTVGSGAPVIEPAVALRAPEAVQFQLAGDVAALARTVAAGPLRRRFGRGMARVTGDRGALSVLEQLAAARLGPAELVGAGTQLDPILSFRLLALLLDPPKMAGEHFSIAHRPAPGTSTTAALHVHGSAPPTVSELGLELPATTTVVCRPSSLLAVITGRRAEAIELEGDERPLTLLERWLEHA
jgi:hypothetical protein